MAAGAGADREVEHLHGEDERRDQAGHRRGAVVELAAGAAQRDADAATAATAPVATDVGASRKPSGTCMRSPAAIGRLGPRPFGALTRATLLHIVRNKRSPIGSESTP